MLIVCHLGVYLCSFGPFQVRVVAWAARASGLRRWSTSKKYLTHHACERYCITYRVSNLLWLHRCLTDHAYCLLAVNWSRLMFFAMLGVCCVIPCYHDMQAPHAIHTQDVARSLVPRHSLAQATSLHPHTCCISAQRQYVHHAPATTTTSPWQGPSRVSQSYWNPSPSNSTSFFCHGCFQYIPEEGGDRSRPFSRTAR